MKGLQSLDMENNHPPMENLLAGEIERIYLSKSQNTPLRPKATESASLTELQQIAQTIPAELLTIPALTEDDLPRSFNLDNLVGHKVCLTFMPFSDTGKSLNRMSPEDRQNFQQNQSFYKVLFADPAKQNLTTGFGENQGFFYNFNPIEIQSDLNQNGCTFTIDQKFEHPELAKIWYVQKYNAAAANLQKLLGLV